MSHVTLHRDLSAVRGHNFPYQIEPKPCPARFRGIERLENLPELLGQEADPGIADLQLDLGRCLQAAEGETPTLRHGLHGVLHKVEERAPEGIVVQGDLTELTEPVALKGDATGG